MNEVLSREAFMQKYIMIKSTSNKPLDQILADATKAYEFASTNSWKAMVNGGSNGIRH